MVDCEALNGTSRIKEATLMIDVARVTEVSARSSESFEQYQVNLLVTFVLE